MNFGYVGSLAKKIAKVPLEMFVHRSVRRLPALENPLGKWASLAISMFVCSNPVRVQSVFFNASAHGG